VDLITLVACGGTTFAPVATEAPAPAVDEAIPEMSATRLLERASLDLRGIRPSIDELDAVEADPDSVDASIDSFLQEERFGARVRSMFAEIYLTRQDSWYVSAADYGLEDEPGWADAVGDEPLRILSTIAEEDLPYTDIVTADWTMADEQLGAAWPLDYPHGATGWQKVHYTDGRPVAGVLTTNGMWWRYMSNGSNANRGRANAVSRILLCSDYLTRPIEFDRNVNLLDEGAVTEAVKTNEGCLGCHATLDPMASYYWGFYYYFYDSAVDTTGYHAEREHLWSTVTETAPAYYGATGYTLEDLGEQIAADPRLTACVVEQVFGLLNRRSVQLDDTAALLAHQEAFAAGGNTLRPLFASVMAGPEYRSGATDEARYTPVKMVSADQLASQVEDLTGFRFTYAGYDMLGTDTYGLRTLAGGVDGVYNTSPASQPTATMLLVQERLAEGAAAYVAEADRADLDHARLFTEISFAETPDTGRDAMVTQIQRLHLRIFGQRVAEDGPEVAANLELWQDLYAAGHDTQAAWAGLLSVLLRDPAFLLY
jgi:hypothetical protein